MAFLGTLNIIGSGLLAQQTRLDVISENITNLQTTRTPEGGAYRRKLTVLQSESGKDGFREAMSKAYLREEGTISNRREANWLRSWTISNRGMENAGGVRVQEIQEDESELPFVYDPTHPDANEEGYVELPNITLVLETADAMAASQAYNADVTAFNVLKQVISKGLEIGGR